MTATAIEWTDTVWNPTTGCDRVSPGCDHCYALTMAKRLKAMGAAKYQRDGDPKTSGPGFGVSVHIDVVVQPLSWRKPRRVFVNSMSDLFHADVPDDFIAQVFAVMQLTPQHTYQVLTKRHARMRSLLSSRDFLTRVDDWRVHHRSAAGDFAWPLPNVWLGVSVENQRWADLRIPALMETPAAVRFLSAEPLLGPITLTHLHSHCPTHDFAGGFCVGPCSDRRVPDWVIVGGESGRGARPMHVDWVRALRDQCASARIEFFFKQWGGIRPKTGGRELDGRTWDEYPGGAS